MESLKERFENELGKKSAYYEDNLIDSVFLRELDSKDPSPSIGFLVGEARPEIYEIGAANATSWSWPLQIQVICKHGSQEEGLDLIRTLTRRIFLCLYRAETAGDLYITDSLGVLQESCVKYNVTRRNYGYGQGTGGLFFGALIDVEFTINMTIN
jgi:hypothetical protein